MLEWPNFSPDLNPIENLLAILNQRLREQTFLWGIVRSKSVNKLERN